MLLCGYAFFGRPFAYLHVPGVPLYLGEAVLALGLAEALTRMGRLQRLVVTSPALRFVVALLVLGLLRLAVDLPSGGIEAVRDSAVVYYAVLAPLVALAVRARPGLLGSWLIWMERAMPAFLLWAPVAVVLERRFSASAPTVPDSLTSIVQFKPGDIGVFCAMSIAYLWLRPEISSRLLATHRTAWTTVAFAGLLTAGTQNRGGLLAGALVLVLALARAPKRTGIFFSSSAALGVVLMLALAFDVKVTLRDRELSVAQLAENLTSLVEDEDTTGLDDGGSLGDNVEWRTRYWARIVAENGTGPLAPRGVGFGENLAVRYDLDTPTGEQGLRNAHNSHLTVLGRLGIPGLALWLGIWVSLLSASIATVVRSSRERRERPWLVAWLATSLVGLLFNAVFDPSLEGPQVAYWCWTVVGVLSQAVRLPALAAYGQRTGADQAAPGRSTWARSRVEAGPPVRLTRFVAGGGRV